RAVLALELLDARRLDRHLPVQRLDGRERDALRVDGVVGAIIVAQTEGGAKVLRHGPEVPNLRRLLEIRPRRDRKAADLVQDRGGVDGRDVLLLVAIAHAQRRASLSAGLLIGGRREAGRRSSCNGAVCLTAELPGQAAAC